MFWIEISEHNICFSDNDYYSSG